MDEISEMLRSPVFWIGTVVIGFLLNISSAYFQRGIDKLLSRLSTGWKNSSRARKKRYETWVDWLTENPEKETYLLLLAINYLLVSILTLLGGIATVIVGKFLVYDALSNPESKLFTNVIIIVFFGMFFMLTISSCSKVIYFYHVRGEVSRKYESTLAQTNWPKQ